MQIAELFVVENESCTPRRSVGCDAKPSIATIEHTPWLSCTVSSFFCITFFPPPPPLDDASYSNWNVRLSNSPKISALWNPPSFDSNERCAAQLIPIPVSSQVLSLPQSYSFSISFSVFFSFFLSASLASCIKWTLGWHNRCEWTGYIYVYVCIYDRADRLIRFQKIIKR